MMVFLFEDCVFGHESWQLSLPFLFGSASHNLSKLAILHHGDCLFAQNDPFKAGQ
jgi:hypothetical protein